MFWVHIPSLLQKHENHYRLWLPWQCWKKKHRSRSKTYHEKNHNYRMQKIWASPVKENSRQQYFLLRKWKEKMNTGTFRQQMKEMEGAENRPATEPTRSKSKWQRRQRSHWCMADKNTLTGKMPKDRQAWRENRQSTGIGRYCNWHYLFLQNDSFLASPPPSLSLSLFLFVGASVCGSQKRVTDSLELEWIGGCELYNMGAGNWTRVLWKRSMNS